MPDDLSKYAPTIWGTESLSDLETPSGQLCQVRAPGLQVLIAAGVLESADTLTTLIDEKHIKRVAPTRAPTKAKATPSKAAQEQAAAQALPEVDSGSLMRDPENLRRIFTLVDKVATHMVVQPQIIAVPENAQDRQPGVIYVDMVDFLDKMYIFQYAIGGSTDLEQFRGEFAASLGSVAAQ